MKKILLSALVASSTVFNAQTTVFSEGFDTFSNLAGNGWINTNQSSPLGASTWAQGGGTAFTGGGQAGGTTSFTLCNYNSATGSGTISNWLITPAIDVQNGDIFSFYTRKGGTSGSYPDRLEFRLSDKGASSATPSGATSVGDFTTLAVSVNPNLTTNTTATNGYPLTWTQYSYTVTGLTTPTSSYKAGFRYYVTDGGPSGTNSNIIGVDTFTVTRPTQAVEDLSKKQGFSVYPTVAEKSINVSFEKGTNIKGISIYDMSGKATGLVKSDVVDNNHFIVDVSNLQSGSYLITAITDKGQSTTKFIKK